MSPQPLDFRFGYLQRHLRHWARQSSSEFECDGVGKQPCIVGASILTIKYAVADAAHFDRFNRFDHGEPFGESHSALAGSTLGWKRQFKSATS